MLSVSSSARELHGGQALKCIGISIKPGAATALEKAAELKEWLHSKGRSVVLTEELEELEPQAVVPLAEIADHIDLMIVLGGDGTLLHIGRRFIGSDVPILGINLGRLGFLTEAPAVGMLDFVGKVLDGKGKVRRRFSLKVHESGSDGFAINDVVLQRNDHPRMIEFEVHVRGQFVFRMRADGIVLATPSGSTAYALSAGGPIVHPDVDAISVVPICPHVLSNRPVVVPANDPIDLHVIESPSPAALNLDGQEHRTLNAGDRIRVEKGGSISLVYLPERHYYEVLRSKLKWAGQAD